MSRWPKDNPSALKAFYGDPASGEIADALVPVTPPFRMTYDGKPIKVIRFHRKAAPALLAALNAIWAYYKRDQKKIDALGISKYAGAYNPRKVRGSATRWSNHAYGAAIDLNAAENALGSRGNMPRPVVDAFEAQGAKWGGMYVGRKDPMHFEFVDNGKSSAVGFIAEPETDADSAEEADTAEAPVAVRAVDPVTAEPRPAVAMQGDPDLWNVQRRLEAMGYNPGGLDGKWGVATSGAIAGFISGRKLPLIAPTSLDMFHDTQAELKAELGKAEADAHKRTIVPERQFADDKTVEAAAPEIKPVKQGRFAAILGAIGTFFAMIFNAIVEYFRDAMEMVANIKDAVPTEVFFALVFGVCIFFYWKAKSGAEGITTAFKTGERL